MTVSIIIATYNRCVLLKETLNSLFQLFSTDLATSGSEVLIIDNNSSDDTKLVAESFLSRYSFIKYHVETNQGLSHARNRGVKESNSDFLIFVDDDVEFHPNWLREILKPFEDPNVGMAGGKMLPFKIDIPEWLPKRYYYLIGVIDLGDQVRSDNQLSGGNIAVYKPAIAEAGLFNVKLGRTGKKLMGGEEVDLSFRIKKTGYKLIYNPGAVVYHKIANKINADYIFNFVYLEGNSAAQIDKRLKPVKFTVKKVYSLAFSLFKKPAADSMGTNGRTLRYLYLKGYASL